MNKQRIVVFVSVIPVGLAAMIAGMAMEDPAGAQHAFTNLSNLWEFLAVSWCDASIILLLAVAAMLYAALAAVLFGRRPTTGKQSPATPSGISH